MNLGGVPKHSVHNRGLLIWFETWSSKAAHHSTWPESSWPSSMILLEALHIPTLVQTALNRFSKVFCMGGQEGAGNASWSKINPCFQGMKYPRSWKELCMGVIRWRKYLGEKQKLGVENILYFYSLPSVFFWGGVHLGYMEFPSLAVELDLQLPAYITAIVSAMMDLSLICTYCKACGNSGSPTHWRRPEIEPAFCPHGC